MASVDSYNNIAPRVMIPPASYTGTQTPSTGVDTQGYESISALIYTGVITDGTWTVTLEESDTSNADFTAVAAADMIGSLPGPFTNVASGFDNKVYKVGYIGHKRYIRVVVTETVMGTGIFGAIIERGAPHTAPTPTDPNA